MKKMKKSLFLRSFFISMVLVFCFGFGFFGMAKAYKNIRLVAYGEYVNAIELKDGVLRIFDFVVNVKK